MSKYNILVTSNITGISTHCLRAWEKRYGIISPERNDSGHRVYNDKDLEHLKLLNQLCSLGHNISQLADKNIEELKQLLTKSGVINNIDEENNINGSDSINSKELLNVLLLALEDYRLDIVSHELYNMKMKLTCREIALDVIGPLVRSVGMKVMEDKLTIAQEHALSSVIKYHLGQYIFKGHEKRNRSSKLIAITTPEGEYHEFGILLASLLCSHYKHNFFYLGPNMPSGSLSHAAKSIDADYIILGTTLATVQENKNFLNSYISDVLKNISDDQKLIIGGPGFFDVSKFKKKKNLEYMPSMEHLDSFLKEI